MRGWNPIPNNQSHCNFLSKAGEGIRVSCTERQRLAWVSPDCLGMARLFEWPAEHRPSGRGWMEGLGLLLGGREQLATSCATAEVLGKMLFVYRLVCMDVFVNGGAGPCSGVCCPFVFSLLCSWNRPLLSCFWSGGLQVFMLGSCKQRKKQP